MALCTNQQGVDYVAGLRINEQDALLNSGSLSKKADEISDQLIEILERRGYLAEDADPLAVFDPAQLLICEWLTSAKLAQVLMTLLSEAIDPRLIGIRNTQKDFTVAGWDDLQKERFYPIFFPSEYSDQMGEATTVPTTAPQISGTYYASVTLVQYISPGWVPDSNNQISSDVCNRWIQRASVEVYALALTKGYTIVNLTARQARALGEIVNTIVSALVLQANSFGDTKIQASIAAFEKMKEAKELKFKLMTGKLDQTFLD